MLKDSFSIEELICDETFQQYCLGSSLSAQIQWEDWIANHPTYIDDVNEAKRLIFLLSAQQGNRLEQLKQLREGIDSLENFKSIITPLTSVPKPVERNNPVFRYLTGIAASFALIAILYLYNRTEPAFTKHVANKSSAAKTIISGNQDRKTTILIDGSVITLRKNSKLTIKGSFSLTDREVWLRGEGFFDVQHDPAHPFIVHTLNNDVRVLGTVFNIKAYPGEGVTETSLIRGRVEVIPHNNPEAAVTLKPNQKLLTTLTSAKATTSDEKKTNHVVNMSGRNKADDEIQWVRSRLDIENEPLSAIASKLQKWYGIDIVFKDEEVKNYRYSGVFENENVLKSLEALQLSYPFNFKVEENKISISSK